jgi:hypothetical protein
MVTIPPLEAETNSGSVVSQILSAIRAPNKRPIAVAQRERATRFGFLELIRDTATTPNFKKNTSPDWP